MSVKAIEVTDSATLATATVDVEAKWRKSTYSFNLPVATTIRTVKTLLTSKTNVLQKRQKLLGLSTISALPGKTAGSAVADSTKLSELKLKKNKISILMMGTPESQIFVDPNDLPASMRATEVVNDLDWTGESFASSSWLSEVENTKTLNAKIASTEIHVMNEARNRPLLVLDVSERYCHNFMIKYHFASRMPRYYPLFAF